MNTWKKKVNKIIVFFAIICLFFSIIIVGAEFSLAVITNRNDHCIKSEDIHSAQSIRSTDNIKTANQKLYNDIHTLPCEISYASSFLTNPEAEEVKEDEEGFVSLFNGRDLSGWTGDTISYVAENGKIVIYPSRGKGGNLFTKKEYGDFILRFEFKLTPGANNGLGIRAPLSGDAAYSGMEIQILDNTAERYNNLKPYQFHGSIYGVVPAKRGYLKPVGEWNFEEVIAKGRRITVKLNGVIIVDADIDEASTPKTMDGKEHPGLKRDTGHIGFLGHGSHIEFRNIRIKELK